MTFTTDFLNSSIKKASKEEYASVKSEIIEKILNAKIEGERIRIPLIMRYIQFQPFTYDDYEALLKNNADLLDERSVFYCFCDIDVDLHFRNFFKEFARIDDGVNNVFDDNFLLPVEDTTIYHYLPIQHSKFPSLLIANQHLRTRIKERIKTLGSSFIDYNRCQVNIQYMLPRGEYAMNKNILKIILEIKY